VTWPPSPLTEDTAGTDPVAVAAVDVGATASAFGLACGYAGAMTRDGRPSRIKDIRLFHRADQGWDGAHEATAFARRLAWWLNGEGFGIGHDPALYVTFDSGLAPGVVVADPPTFTPDDWWFREASVGVPDDFPGDDAVGTAEFGVVACLKALKPDDTELIDRAAQIVRVAGSECRFLLKATETSRDVVEVSTTVGTWPQPSLLYVGLTEKSTGSYRQAPPAELAFYDDGVLLASKVRIARRKVDLLPRTSVPARIVAASHARELSWHVDDFVDAERPLMSSVLKFR